MKLRRSRVTRCPPGWHLAYFPAASRLASLGADGLPVTGGVLPEMPLPRRMYAGATLTFHTPIRVGDSLRRETSFSDVQLRKGSTGTLIVATQTRKIFTPFGIAITEDAVSVFREAVPPGTRSGIPQTEPPPAGMTWHRTITPDPVTLFRYSALTFNPHRIHYDRPYAMDVEGYPGLVVHGPFSQQCLLDLLRDNVSRPITKFAMRARAPLFDVAPFTLAGGMISENEADLFAISPNGGIAMQARATMAYRIQADTACRYRCQVAWPSTGITTTRPNNNGIDPATSAAAITRPQTAIVPGLVLTTLIDVRTAVSIDTFLSSNMGNATTLIVSTTAAKTNPTPHPATIIVQPAGVCSTSWMNCDTDSGGIGPSVST